jgi:hypothetical protein
MLLERTAKNGQKSAHRRDNYSRQPGGVEMMAAGKDIWRFQFAHLWMRKSKSYGTALNRRNK